MVGHVSFCYDLDEGEILGVVRRLNDIHTIFFPLKLKTSPGEPFLEACIPKFKCIKVLDLSESGFDKLPSSISNLKHLKFLSLANNERIKKLPESICKLFHLQILLLMGCKELEKLP